MQVDGAQVAAVGEAQGLAAAGDDFLLLVELGVVLLLFNGGE